MIDSRKSLNYYLECDMVALGKQKKRPELIGDEIYKFERSLRIYEYYANKKCKLFRYIFARIRYHNLSIKLGFTIPINCIGPGLCIVHYGTIVIADNCTIGKNCRIHTGVNIGATSGGRDSAIIGDNVYIGPGAKIIGRVEIGDNVVIGANAVVVNNIESGITVGGVPAKKISDKDSTNHIIKATEWIKESSIAPMHQKGRSESSHTER